MKIPFFVNREANAKKLQAELDKPMAAVNAGTTNARSLIGDTMPGYTGLITETGITPAKIQTALQAYRTQGKLQGLSTLFYLFLDSDDNLQSATDVRKEALKAALWSYAQELPAAKKEFFDQLISEKLGSWIDVFIEGKLCGWHFNQIMWEQDEQGYWIPAELKEYNNLDLRTGSGKLELYENDRLSDKPALPYRFITHLYRRPKLHTIIKYYVFYAFALNNWAQFTETYGKPMRLGKYDAMTTSTELTVLKAAVKALGTDQAAIISKNTDIEFKDFLSKDASKGLYESLCTFVETRVTKAVLGQTLATQQGDTGSYAQAKVHDQVRDDIKQADINDLRQFVNQILDYVDAVNFGGTGVNVWFSLPKQVNLSERIIIDQALQNMGLPLSQDYLYDTYDVSRVEKGQDVVEKQGFSIQTEGQRDREDMEAAAEWYFKRAGQ